MVDTKHVDFEAGSLTTSFNSMIPECPLNALKMDIYLFILDFLTGFNALMTTLMSSLT